MSQPFFDFSAPSIRTPERAFTGVIQISGFPLVVRPIIHNPQVTMTSLNPTLAVGRVNYSVSTVSLDLKLQVSVIED